MSDATLASEWSSLFLCFLARTKVKKKPKIIVVSVATMASWH